MTQPQIICVDIGNSGLRCARLVDGAVGEVLRIDWPVHFSTSDTADHHADGPPFLVDRLTNWLSGFAPESTQSRWLVSSVQRTIESHLRRCVERLGGEYRLVTYTDLAIEVRVDQPERVGIDRLLAAQAAMTQSPARPLIVIQAGSAITVDLVEHRNQFSGGAILPGVPIMLRLLSSAADLLPQVAAIELFELPPLPGKNTSAAMSAGTSSAVVGGVQHLVARYREQCGLQTPVILSGGDGPRLAPHIPGPLLVVDHLVLRGLAILCDSADLHPRKA